MKSFHISIENKIFLYLNNAICVFNSQIASIYFSTNDMMADRIIYEKTKILRQKAFR